MDPAVGWIEARKAAANGRWLTRGLTEEADHAMVQVIRALQFHALEACCGDRSDAAYRTLFPDDRKGLVEGGVAQRQQAVRFLVGRMDANTGNPAGAQRLREAVAAWQGAMEAWKEAEAMERNAVQALKAQVRAYRKAVSMVRCQVSIRLQDVAAARPYFPTLSRNRAVQEPEPPGTGGVQSIAHPQPTA